MGVIIALVVVISGYFYASPYLVLNNIKSAVEVGDSEKLSAYIDYPSVRQGLKDQFKAKILNDVATDKTNEWQALGAKFASTMIDKVVDTMVTPEGVTLLLQGKIFKDGLMSPMNEDSQSSERLGKSDKMETSTRYLSMNVFEISVKKPNQEKMLKVIMHRDGLSWKVNKLILDLPTENLTQKQKIAEAQKSESLPITQTFVVGQQPASSLQAALVFNFSKVQREKIIESCYENPCSIAKITEFQALNTAENDVEVELSFIGGTKDRNSSQINWSTKSGKFQVRCSIQQPAVRYRDQVTILPINSNINVVPMSIMAVADLYMKTCHGDFNGTLREASKKYGYNVPDDVYGRSVALR